MLIESEHFSPPRVTFGTQTALLSFLHIRPTEMPTHNNTSMNMTTEVPTNKMTEFPTKHYARGANSQQTFRCVPALSLHQRHAVCEQKKGKV